MQTPNWVLLYVYFYLYFSTFFSFFLGFLEKGFLLRRLRKSLARSSLDDNFLRDVFSEPQVHNDDGFGGYSKYGTHK